MDMSRRKSLALIGGGVILAAGAAAGGFLGTRTPRTAIAPWDRAGHDDADLRKWALSYAILAPNPHNRQPWLVDLGTDRSVVLWRDKTRELPETDPFQRQLVIGLGCFLEQMRDEMLRATPAYAAVTSVTNTRQAQIAAGGSWVRLNLATTLLGLSLHPVSQTLQEYPAMAPHYRRAHQLLASEGETVQMLGRLGYGPTVQRTPRWPLETRLI